MKHQFVCCLTILVGVFFLTACGRAPDPQKLGVFADTNKGLLELSSYGEETDVGEYNLGKVSPQKISKINLFYINMPGVEIASSKLFLLSSLEKNFIEEKYTPLKIEMETTKNNIYKIRCPELDGKKVGLAYLKIKMPLGTPDRIYPLQIAE